MSLNDLYRLIIMEDQSIASDGHSFRTMLDDVFLGNLTGRDYLTANIGSGTKIFAKKAFKGVNTAKMKVNVSGMSKKAAKKYKKYLVKTCKAKKNIKV